MPSEPNPKKGIPAAMKSHIIACQRAMDFLTRNQKFVDTFNNTKLVEAQIRLDKMEEIYLSYQEHSSA